MDREKFESDLRAAEIIYEDIVTFHRISHDRPDIIHAVVRLNFDGGRKRYLIVQKGYPEVDTIVICPTDQKFWTEEGTNAAGIFLRGERILPLVCQMLNDIENKTKGTKPL